jgi:hypothetical protein
MSEGVVGVVAIVLAILGLAGARPFYMAAIGVIALGVGLVAEGAVLAGRYSRLLRDTSEGQVATSHLGGGLTAETLAGIAGIALGILALVGVRPFILLPIAILVYGGGLVATSGSATRLADLVVEWAPLGDAARRVAREASSAASSAHLLVGIAAMALGVLALIGFVPLLLTLVALLGLGASMLISGSTIGSRALRTLHHG